MAASGDLDRVLEEFPDDEEGPDLWDDADIASYRDVVEAAENVELTEGYVVIELDAVTAEALVDRARERAIEPGRLAREILRRELVEGA